MKRDVSQKEKFLMRFMEQKFARMIAPAFICASMLSANPLPWFLSALVNDFSRPKAPSPSDAFGMVSSHGGNDALEFEVIKNSFLKNGCLCPSEGG